MGHGFLMIFFLVMPSLFGGFGNYFVPIFQGSPEVVYPRVNNFSILILILSYLFFILSFFSEFGGGTGWTFYPPLSTSFMSLSPSSTANLIFGLLISGISSCQDDTTTGNGCLDQCVQFFVSSNSQLQMAGSDTLDLQILGGVTCQLQNLSSQILEDSGRVNGSGGTHTTMGCCAVLQMPMNTTDGKLKSSTS